MMLVYTPGCGVTIQYQPGEGLMANVSSPSSVKMKHTSVGMNKNGTTKREGNFFSQLAKCMIKRIPKGMANRTKLPEIWYHLSASSLAMLSRTMPSPSCQQPSKKAKMANRLTVLRCG